MPKRDERPTANRRARPAFQESGAGPAPRIAATAPCASVAFLPAPPRGRGTGQDRGTPWRLAVFCGALLAASLSGPTPARADGLADARDLFGRGRDLRLHGDCENAAPLFKQAFDVYPAGLGSLRNFAECEELLGHLASARQAWLDLGRALLANYDPKYTGWALDAEQGAERLRPVEPAAGDAPTGDAATGDAKVAPVAAAEPPSSPAPGVKEARRPEATRTVGWVALAVGGASLVGAGVALVVRQVALDDLPGCAATRCPDSMTNAIQPTVNRGHAAATLADTLGAVGLAGVASGLVLLWIGRRHSPDVALLAAPSGLVAAGRF